MNIHPILFEGEELLESTKKDPLVLTTHRVYYKEGSAMNGYFISMNLENISSVEVKTSSKFTLLIYSFFFGAVALVTYVEGLGMYAFIALIAAVVFGAIYFTSRRKVMLICSDGGSVMTIPVNGLTNAAISQYLDVISLAKNNRLNTLYNLNKT